MTRRALTDPTAVVARRGGAWFIDTVLCALAGAVPALLLADAYELNRASNGFDIERHGDDVALFLKDTVIVLRKVELGITVGAFLGAVLVFLVLLPGLRGWTPGYLAAEVRLVRRDGERAGIGRALVRTLAWVVDILPGIPLVAYGSARATKRHQRVGDLLAHSYVVDKRAVGRPVDADVEPEEAFTPMVEPEPEPAPEPAPTPAPVAAAAAAAPVEDDEDVIEAEWWEEDGEEAAPLPATTAATAVPATVAAPPDGVPPDQPIWDRRNRRYVLWHSKSGRWLAHTDQGWAPFEADEG